MSALKTGWPPAWESCVFSALRQLACLRSGAIQGKVGNCYRRAVFHEQSSVGFCSKNWQEPLAWLRGQVILRDLSMFMIDKFWEYNTFLRAVSFASTISYFASSPHTAHFLDQYRTVIFCVQEVWPNPANSQRQWARPCDSPGVSRASTAEILLTHSTEGPEEVGRRLAHHHLCLLLVAFLSPLPLGDTEGSSWSVGAAEVWEQTGQVWLHRRTRSQAACPLWYVLFIIITCFMLTHVIRNLSSSSRIPNLTQMLRFGKIISISSSLQNSQHRWGPKNKGTLVPGDVKVGTSCCHAGGSRVD